jgi:UDP-N-acetylglucosamine acyltransferase
VLADVPPYVTAMGNTAKPYGINAEGLKRRDFNADTIAEIRRAYKLLYRSGFKLEQAREAIGERVQACPELGLLLDFLSSTSQRSIIR